MGIKPARESFTREEIIDILKRNAALYKDEVDFVDYLVDLTMYLLDKHYGENRISPWAAPDPPPARAQPAPVPGIAERDRVVMPPTVAELQDRNREPGSERYRLAPTAFTPVAAPPPPPGPPSLQHPSMPPPPGGREPEIVNPSSGRIRIAGIVNPASPAASPQAGRQEVEVDPASGRFRVAQQGAPAQNPATTLPPSRIEPALPPLVTPSAPALRERKRREPEPRVPEPPPEPVDADFDPPEEPAGERRPSGAVRKPGNFRMFRSVKSSTGVEILCPGCGLKVPLQTKQCPNCGRLL